MVRTLVRFSAGSVALTIALALSVVASAANAALAPALRIDPAAVDALPRCTSSDGRFRPP